MSENSEYAFKIILVEKLTALTKSNLFTSFDNKFTICPVVVFPSAPLLSLNACKKEEYYCYLLQFLHKCIR